MCVVSGGEPDGNGAATAAAFEVGADTTGAASGKGDKRGVTAGAEPAAPPAPVASRAGESDEVGADPTGAASGEGDGRAGAAGAGPAAPPAAVTSRAGESKEAGAGPTDAVAGIAGLVEVQRRGVDAGWTTSSTPESGAVNAIALDYGLVDDVTLVELARLAEFVTAAVLFADSTLTASDFTIMRASTGSIVVRYTTGESVATATATLGLDIGLLTTADFTADGVRSVFTEQSDQKDLTDVVLFCQPRLTSQGGAPGPGGKQASVCSDDTCVRAAEFS